MSHCDKCGRVLNDKPHVCIPKPDFTPGITYDHEKQEVEPDYDLMIAVTIHDTEKQ